MSEIQAGTEILRDRESPTILFVDDEPNTLSALRRLMHPSGYRIITAQGGAEGLQVLARDTVDLVVSDMRMPEMNGAQFLQAVSERWPETVRVLLTGYADMDVTIDAINRGQIYRYISKPWDDREVTLIITQGLEAQRMERERKRLEALTRQQNEELKRLNASLAEQQNMLKVAADRMQAILQHAADAVITVDATGNIASLNSAAVRLFGYSVGEILGCPLALILPACTLELEAEIAQVSKARSETVGRRKDGSEFPAELSVSRLKERDGYFSTVFLRDVTQRKLAESAITHLAHHDMLTGLPNRRLLADRIEQAIVRARRSGAEFAVMFIDLDNFKPINDTFGHDVGDQLLQLVARRVTVSLREEDTVGRQGGDEFIVLLSSLTYAGSLTMVVEKIQLALAAPFTISGHELQVSASIGIAIYPHDGNSVEALFKNSDKAMYYAKKIGRNNAQFFGSDIKISPEDG